MAVYTAWGNEAHEMESAAIGLSLRSHTYQSLILEEITILDSLGDTGQCLINNTTGTDVGMTNLRVTHLTIRETNELARSLNMGGWEILSETINNRSLSYLDSIVWITGFAVSIAIHDN